MKPSEQPPDCNRPPGEPPDGLLRSTAMLASLLSAALVPSLTLQRAWLERFAVIVPAERATRWLLLLDAACLVLIGLERRRPRLAVPVALTIGFLALNVLGMVANEFFLGLALFHLGVTATTALTLRRGRWFGVTALLLVAALGVAT